MPYPPLLQPVVEGSRGEKELGKSHPGRYCWPWAKLGCGVWGVWVERGNPPPMTSGAQRLSSPIGHCPLSGTLAPSLMCWTFPVLWARAGVLIHSSHLGSAWQARWLHLPPPASPNSHLEPRGIIRIKGQRSPQGRSPWEGTHTYTRTCPGAGTGMVKGPGVIFPSLKNG